MSFYCEPCRIKRKLALNLRFITSLSEVKKLITGDPKYNNAIKELIVVIMVPLTLHVFLQPTISHLLLRYIYENYSNISFTQNIHLQRM